METPSFLKNELKPTQVEWIDVDEGFGDYLFDTDIFAVKDHEGFALLENNSDHISYKEWPAVDDEGQELFDDEGNAVMEGEYFLTLYLENEMSVPVTDQNGNVVRDDLGRLVTRKSRKAEIIATDLIPSDHGRPARIANKFARKLGSARKYRAKDPRTIKRGRKAKAATGNVDIKTFQVELGGDSMWHVVKLGQAEPVARFPGSTDGRQAACDKAAELNDAE